MTLAILRIPGLGFELPAEIIVLGVVTGLTYALLGIGLTLTYKASRVLNFAHGQMGALAAVLVPLLVVNRGVNYWVAFAAAIAAAAAVGAVTEFAVIRRLGRAPRLIVLVATIGVAQLLYVLDAFIPKGDLGRTTYPTPFSATVRIGSLVLGPGQLMILILVPVITGALSVFFRRSTIGVASRAAAENEDAASLAGIPTRKVSLLMWTLAGVLAGVSAILIGPTRPVLTEVALGPQLMVRGLAAAMIGGLDRLPRVFAGGVIIGVVEFLFSWNYPTGGNLELALLVVILLSLLLPRGLGRTARDVAASSWTLVGAARALPAEIAAIPVVRRFRRSAYAALAVVVVLLPVMLSNAQRVLFSSAVILALVALSLVVLMGYTGQVSLGQSAFVTLGALVGGRLVQLGYPPPTALVYAAGVGGVAALVVGLPALRLRGLYLAVTTLGFAVACDSWAYRQRWLVATVDGESSLRIPRPVLFGINLADERNYAWLCLGVLVVVALLIRHLRGTGMGRSMMAVRDNESAAATLGVSPARTKLFAFVLSGVIASVAGFLYGGLLVDFSSLPERTFGVDLSLVAVGVVVLGGVTSIAGAILGASMLRFFTYFAAPLTGAVVGPRFALLVSGGGLLMAVLQNPAGMAAELARQRDRIVVKLIGRPLRRVGDRGDARTPRVSLPARASPACDTAASVHPIEARDITVRYGGLVAVDGVDLYANPGEIVGLIGPNGAGKTTLFEVLSGHLRPDDGRVLVGGLDVTGRRPEQRARLGLGRSFQQARLFDDETIVDALCVAMESVAPSEAVPSLLGLPPSRRAERAKEQRAAAIVDLLGLEPYADRTIAELSTGTRRIAELGCMIAMGARVLLLDEPTAGVAQREVEAFGPLVREIRDHLGATVVIIEHDIPMLLGLADRVYVMAGGQVIAEAAPAEIRSDPSVIAAYLGTDERVIQRSGTAAAALDAVTGGTRG